MKRTRCLVTGGAGFIGSHLCEKLLDLGHEVTCLDNLLTCSEDNISHLKDHQSGFKFMKHDVTVPFNVEVDWIFHLASPASPVHYQSRPIETTRTNVVGTLNVLDLAKEKKARIFLASTSEVYGSPLIHPQPETYWGNVNPIGPRSCYDEGKRCAETLFFDYLREYGLDIRVGRIFNTYGPRMQPNDGRVVSNFIMQALTGNEITIYGKGDQTRSFCYVEDMVEGIVAFMSREEKYPGPLNLGTDFEVKIKDLAEMISKLCVSQPSLVFKPLPQDDPFQRKPDLALARRLINWSPATELSQGLSRTIEYFRK